MISDRSPRGGRGRTASRHARWRRGLARAILAALAVHAIGLVFLRLPAEPPARGGRTLVVVPQPADLDRAAADRRLSRPGVETAGEGAARPTPAAVPTGAATPIPAIRQSPRASEAITIPSTALTELRAATLPLVVTPAGLDRRRLERSAEEIAVARAESLLVARMAGLTGIEPREIGAIGLAGGGVTVAIPWGGFVRADRTDEVWRDRRCKGKDGGKDDKPGEGEARRGQCG